MKRTLLPVLALLFALMFIFTACSFGSDSEDTTDESEEISTVEVNANLTSDTADRCSVSDLLEEVDIDTIDLSQVDAINDVFFYMECTIYSDGSYAGYNTNVAMNGTSLVQVTTSISGIYMGILIDNGVTYLVAPLTLTYVELTDTVLEFIGIEADELVDISSFTLDEDDVTSLSAYTVTIDDVDGYCIVSESDELEEITYIYLIDDDIVQIVTYDTDGNETSCMVITTFSTTIPSDQLNIAYYTEASSVYSFFTALV